ncbi:hypothetical protein E2C01_018399 [Portunus trituberculatus]|uniref:Uncharacterized protein n=1 Tax=Portunus trituberculatus TaxID=210409 RepID=A0A5B7DWA6_PORTR|nr:hypothetical protein [Portunus trituberculatus]
MLCLTHKDIEEPVSLRTLIRYVEEPSLTSPKLKKGVYMRSGMASPVTANITPGTVVSTSASISPPSVDTTLRKVKTRAPTRY